MRLGSSLQMLPFWLAQPPRHLGTYLPGTCLYSGLLGAEVVIVPVHIALSPLYQTCSSTSPPTHPLLARHSSECPLTSVKKPPRTDR